MNKGYAKKKIIFGNLNNPKSTKKNWFIGHFMDEKEFKTENFELKWGKHKKGKKDENAASQKIAKTMGILIYGKFRYHFPDLNKSITLSKEGDYCFYDRGVTHTWEVLEDCLLLSVRWPSIPGDQKEPK